MIARRHLLTGAVAAGSAMILPSSGSACSIIFPPKAEPLNQRRCRRQVEEFVAFLNRAHALPIGAIGAWLDERRLEVDSDLAWSDDQGVHEDHVKKWFKQYRISGGKVDPKPVRLTEMNLIRHLAHRTAYQFTLRKYAYHPADAEGCNGLLTHEEYYGNVQSAYLAEFYNNNLRRIRDFPEWYLERSA